MAHYNVDIEIDNIHSENSYWSLDYIAVLSSWNSTIKRVEWTLESDHVWEDAEMVDMLKEGAALEYVLEDLVHKV